MTCTSAEGTIRKTITIFTDDNGERIVPVAHLEILHHPANVLAFEADDVPMEPMRNVHKFGDGDEILREKRVEELSEKVLFSKFYEFRTSTVIFVIICHPRRRIQMRNTKSLFFF